MSDECNESIASDGGVYMYISPHDRVKKESVS